jgi:hypothetical protein
MNVPEVPLVSHGTPIGVEGEVGSILLTNPPYFVPVGDAGMVTAALVVVATAVGRLVVVGLTTYELVGTG